MQHGDGHIDAQMSCNPGEDGWMAQFLIFLDAGRDWVREPIAGETDFTFASAGPGVRLNIGQHGTIKADYGWQLERLSGTRSGRPEISAILSF
jgi:hemolysin activation/secretion protein